MHWQDYEIRKLALDDRGYPESLKKLKKPPKQVFYRGSLDSKIFKKALAVVGTRRITHYGSAVLARFIPPLVEQGATIVSGFMYGIDTAAHELTCENGGKTVAIFGSGINQVYPLENDKLYTKVLESDGVILSEYSPEVKPKLWSYIQRNRIVAALSGLGVLVVEAGEKSGSLITADAAARLDLPVYAVPGPISSSVSVGTNFLIKSGKAQAATGPSDIKGLNVSSDHKEALPLEGLERFIYKELQVESLSADELAAVLSKDVVEIGNALSIMLLKGVLSEAGGKYHVLKA